MIQEGDPDITFDEKGICSYCHAWIASTNDRRIAVSDKPWMVHQIKKAGQGREYDAVIGLSGGVDSSMALHYAIEQGLRVYAFSVDNGFNDPKADENIMRLVETLKVPFYRYVIDTEKFKELYRAYLKSGLKNLEVTTDHILMAVSYDMAARHKVKYIVSGANVATESIMPRSYGYEARDLKQIQFVYRFFTGKKLKGLPTISIGKYLWYRNVKKIKVVPILDHYEYNRAQSIKLLGDVYGYQSYGDKHGENRLTRWFQNCYLPQKFGLDKRFPHYSSLINSGQMTRDEALRALAQPLEYEDVDLGVDWRISQPYNYTDYPNNEAAWERWYAFFKFLRRFGWKS